MSNLVKLIGVLAFGYFVYFNFYPQSDLTENAQAEELSSDELIPLQLLKARNTGTATQRRARISLIDISATPSTAEARAKAATTIAREVGQQANLDYIDVFLYAQGVESGPFTMNVATARYTLNIDKIPFSNVTWDIKANDFSFTEKDIQIINTWAALRSQHLDNEGFLNEDTLKSHIARVLEIELEEAQIPYPPISTPKEYIGIKPTDDYKHLISQAVQLVRQ
ncbi:hypothetical protein [Pseudovibrio sp. POLY-S9]|uniref:DUF4875 domain-containing protein n=1 Tax=Pseudovibrio sp. POLY-S9 TaxID=1576596 RepID=UPI00070C31C3|nr:hypothetical protein [Pseudovibrio sp. POLY-S9]